MGPGEWRRLCRKSAFELIEWRMKEEKRRARIKRQNDKKKKASR